MSSNPKDFFPIEVATSPFQTLLGHNSAVRCAFFSDDGNLIVSLDTHAIRVWKRRNHQHYNSHSIIKTDTTYMVVSYDGRFIASIHENKAFGKKVCMWSLDGKWIKDLSIQSNACNMAFTPDGAYLVVADDTGLIKLWDIATASLLCESELPPDGIKTRFNNTVRYLAFAPDGRRLAVQWYTSNGAVQIYDIEETLNEENISRKITWKGAVAPEILQAKSFVKGLSYSPDWQYLAVASSSDIECRVQLFDAFSLNLIRSFELTESMYGIAGIVFSADGKYLAVAKEDGTVWIWDVEYHDPILTFPSHTSSMYIERTIIGSIDWSLDNKLIMTAGMGHYENFDPGTGNIVPGENDFTIKLWEIKKNK